jgi:hypothetical protein
MNTSENSRRARAYIGKQRAADQQRAQVLGWHYKSYFGIQAIGGYACVVLQVCAHAGVVQNDDEGVAAKVGSACAS